MTGSGPHARGVPVTYTNRKGVTYYLCQGQTKTGKVRYYFARAPQDMPIATIPTGYVITESVNGIVSLVKDRPSLITPAESAIVEAAVSRHPQAHKYRVARKHKQIDVYEQWGPDATELASLLHQDLGVPRAAALAHMQGFVERTATYTQVIHFLLEDGTTRTFRAERLLSLGIEDDWIPVGWGTLTDLVQRAIPALGTDDFYDLLPWDSAP